MNPIWDQILVVAAIAAAVGYFVWSAFARKGKGASGCGGGCDCGGKKPARK